MQVWNVLHAARWKCRTQTTAKKRDIWAPSHNFVGLYLRHWGTFWQSEKNRLSSNTSSKCRRQYGELRPNIGWDLLASFRQPCKFQRVSRLGSVTLRQSSSGRQPNFAALNRGRHLRSAGRPSRWALAHILVVSIRHQVKSIIWKPRSRTLKIHIWHWNFASVTCATRMTCNANGKPRGPVEVTFVFHSFSSSRMGI